MVRYVAVFCWHSRLLASLSGNYREHWGVRAEYVGLGIDYSTRFLAPKGPGYVLSSFENIIVILFFGCLLTARNRVPFKNLDLLCPHIELRQNFRDERFGG